MRYENYSQAWEAEVVDLWNRCCTFDPIEVNRFRNQALFDDNFNPSLAWVAVDGDALVGFAFGTKRKFPYLERGLEPERGWINVIFVAPEVRRQGVATALLSRIEGQLAEMGAANITLGAYSPNYFFAGVDTGNYADAAEFFASRGYVAGDTHYSMGKNLHGFQVSGKIRERKAALEAKGYSFVPFDYSRALEVLDFLRRELGAGWKRNALISMRERTAEDRMLLVIDPSGAVCGWCMRGIDGNQLRFGPIGVAAAERNNGIGSVLLDLYCFEMAKRGIYRMFFITTDEPGRRYYERHGLEVIRTFTDYRKQL